SLSFGHASSVPLDAAKTVLDAFQRPSCPGYREEREPLFDEEIGIHVRRDEVHAWYDPVTLASRRDGVQACLIGVAGVLQRYAQLDGEVRRADQQHIDPADADNRVEVGYRLLRFDHWDDQKLCVHRVEIGAIIFGLAPFAAHARVAAFTKRGVQAGPHHGFSFLLGVDHGHDDASSAKVEGEADDIRA